MRFRETKREVMFEVDRTEPEREARLEVEKYRNREGKRC